MGKAFAVRTYLHKPSGSKRLPASPLRDNEAASALPRSPPSSPSNPFDDLDEGTRNLIRSLYQEKDEARENYAEETKKTSQLEAQLETADNMAVTAQAQLAAVDARVAGMFPTTARKLLSTLF